MYIPAERRDEGFKRAVLEWLEEMEAKVLHHPDAEGISDEAIRQGLDAAGVKGLVRVFASRILDWLLPEAGVKLIFRTARLLIEKVA